VFTTICRRNRKCYSLSSTFKAEARFRVKTKVSPEVTNYEQFLPHISGAVEDIFFPDRGIRKFVVARLTVCRVLVLTHNFEMKRPVER